MSEAQPTPRRACVEWGAAGRALAGEPQSGDAYAVTATQDGALVAVIDGLGHGLSAASAAQKAISVIERHPDLDLEALTARCHEALRGTRGAVMSLARIAAAANTLTWLGVGNVEGLLLRAAAPARESLLLRGGVVGYQIPRLAAAVLPLRAQDLLLFASDGISSGFITAVPRLQPAQKIAELILDKFAKASDDATVVVVRYLGDPA